MENARGNNSESERKNGVILLALHLKQTVNNFAQRCDQHLKSQSLTPTQVKVEQSVVC